MKIKNHKKSQEEVNDVIYNRKSRQSGYTYLITSAE